MAFLMLLPIHMGVGSNQTATSVHCLWQWH